jgi:hypothetical protein
MNLGRCGQEGTPPSPGGPGPIDNRRASMKAATEEHAESDGGDIGSLHPLPALSDGVGGDHEPGDQPDDAEVQEHPAAAAGASPVSEDHHGKITKSRDAWAVDHESHQAVENRMHEAIVKVQQWRAALENAIADRAHAKKAYDSEHNHDPNHAPLPRQWAFALLILIPEWYACYLAAQVIDAAVLWTVAFATFLLVVLVACEYWYDSTVRNRTHRQKRWALAALITMVVILGVMRLIFGYIIERGHSLLIALALALALTAFTAALIGISCAALHFSESIAAYQARRKLKKADRVVKATTVDLRHAEAGERHSIAEYRRVIHPHIRKLAVDEGLDERKLTKALDEQIQYQRERP